MEKPIFTILISETNAVRARLICKALEKEADNAKRLARTDSLYRPERRLADIAVRLGCPHDIALSLALEFV